MAGFGLGIAGNTIPIFGNRNLKEIRIGIIGLDTSHSIEFTRIFNDPDAGIDGFKVVAAYPQGSRDIKSSLEMIPGSIEEIKKMGVKITGSIEELLLITDAILLETNDGRLHAEQAFPVIKASKPLFIDKPIAASLADAVSIFEAAKRNNVPVFSASSLRFMESAQQIVQGKAGKVLGADTYSPATIEKTHPDLFWYGIHGIETLFTVMGTGCRSVVRHYTEGSDIVIGVWEGNRIGSFRGIREGAKDFGGKVFGDKGIVAIGPWDGYKPLVKQIADFFRTGKAPVTPRETLEIFAFMEAAEESKFNRGTSVNLSDMIKKAGGEAFF